MSITTPTAGAARFADGLERSLWTVAEGAGATGILAGYQALPLPDVPLGYAPLAIVLLAGVLAGIKSAVAQRWGNGTAATLPLEYEPIPAEITQGELPAGVGMPLAEPTEPLYTSGRNQLASQTDEGNDPELDDELVAADDEKPRHARDDNGDGVPDVAGEAEPPDPWPTTR